MKRSTIIASVTAVAVIGGGAAVANASLNDSGTSDAAQELQATADADRDDSGSAEDSRVQGTSDGSEAPGGDATADDRTGVAEQVVATAEEAVPGHVVDVELELDDGYWEVDVAGDDGREHELKVSLDGTEVLKQEDEDDNVRAKHELLSEAEVNAADAARIAEERLGGHAEEIDLDREDGVWEVELRDADGVAWELDIDVHTGEVGDVERDD